MVAPGLFMCHSHLQQGTRRTTCDLPGSTNMILGIMLGILSRSGFGKLFL